MDYDRGNVICRVCFKPMIPVPLPGGALTNLLKKKILNDVEAAVRNVCDVQDRTNRDVFIVHGHNLTAQRKLKEHVYRLGLRPVVLEEQNTMSMTIIEALEDYASTCRFAFIIMTPDDLRRRAEKRKTQWRARQNVILELGWFMARLKRKQVLILCQGQVEIPSDIQGVLFLRFNESILEIRHEIEKHLRGVGLI